MPIIVTGGAGFIGSHLVKELNRRGRQDIWVVDNLDNEYRTLTIHDCLVEKVMHWTEFREMLRRPGCLPADVSILHQGACTDTLETDVERVLDTNYAFSVELILAATVRGFPVVYASSAAVYGHHSHAVCEDPRYEKPLNVYGTSKLMTDRLARMTAEGMADSKAVGLGDSTVVGLRYFNVYGTREGLKGRMASMPYQLCHQLMRTKRMQLYEGSDQFSRDFVSVEDVVKVNLYFLFGPNKRGVFNCGTGEDCTFGAVADTLMYALDMDGEVEEIPFPDGLRDVYQTFTCADLTALRAAGYEDEFVPMTQGVDKMAKQLAAGRF